MKHILNSHWNKGYDWKNNQSPMYCVICSQELNLPGYHSGVVVAIDGCPAIENFELLSENTALMNSTASVIYGRPDCWDHVSDHTTPAGVVAALRQARGKRHIIRADSATILYSGDIR